jgi:hypothetical protein
LTYITGNAISNDNDIVNVSHDIKPKDVKALAYSYANDLAARALIADAAFMKSTIQVNINSTNPNRLDITWSYKRTGNAYIVATTVTAGFNFGN